MKTETTIGKVRYILSNDNLNVSDKVFCIGRGRCENGEFIFHHFDYNAEEFPHNPHTIIDLFNSDYKPYEIKTDMGYGPKESYFKIISVFELTEKKTGRFVRHEWKKC